MIAAFRHFYDERLPVNLILVLSSEEERSGKRNGPDMAQIPDDNRRSIPSYDTGRQSGIPTFTKAGAKVADILSGR